MDRKPLPPGLHVVLGDHAAEIFSDAFGSERLLVDQDVLSVGPTRPCENIAAWNAMRFGYWSRIVPGLIHEHWPSTRNLLDNLESLRAAERITIWCATSVSEQLFVAHVIHRAIEAGCDAGRIWIVQFETLRNRKARVLGIGELSATQLGEHPEARPLTDEARRHYQAAWAALLSDNPTRIEAFGESHPDAGDALRHAMQCLLRRYPDKLSGLTAWDRELLEDVRNHGPRGARVIGHTLVKNLEDADLVGDWYLFGRLLRLGNKQLPKPLLDIA